MDKVIQFIANYDEWKAIKKIKIDEKTDSKTIMEFLAGLGTSLDKKIEENLRKIVDLAKLDAALNELPAEKSEAAISSALTEIGSRKINSVINEICGKPELQKNEQKELIGFCKIYALRSFLQKAGFSVDYSSIEIPGLKRIKKVKV